jgi:pimeloyl-ACP methyl ester carboxylesterase
VAVEEPSRIPPGRAVELAGRGTTFVREVAGPPGAPTVILLHGLTATGGLNWMYAFEPLADRYRVLAVDHRGHGRGIRTPRFRLSDCADDIVALADVLGIDHFIAAGYSMGGPIAQLAWHRHPGRVSGLVLCATSRNFRGQPREQALFSLLPAITLAARAAPGPARRALAARLLDARMPDFPARDWVMAEFRGNDPATVAQAAAAIGRFSSRDWIGDVDVPAAVVVTTQDRLVPPHRQHKLAAAIPGATLHPVDGDHGVCAARPDLFVPALLSACASVAARTPRPMPQGRY